MDTIAEIKKLYYAATKAPSRTTSIARSTC